MKAQTSMEALLITIAVFVIFAIALSLTVSKQAESGNIKAGIEKANACNAFANEVKSVFVLGNGTKSSVKTDYNIIVSNRTAAIDGVVCGLCCGLTKNSSLTYTIRSGIARLENINGNVFLAGPTLESAARYSKPAHSFVSGETSDVSKQDGTSVTVDKDNRVLHVAFDAPLVNDKITAYVRCRNDETIQLKNESLGAVISNASCADDVWMWINLTASGSVFDLNTNSRDVDYDFIGVIW